MKIEAGRIDDLIVTIPDIEWEFQCKYSTVYTIEKGQVSIRALIGQWNSPIRIDFEPIKDKTVSSSTLEHEFNKANGQFKFDFEFFETSNFREIQQDPTFMVGQQINFGSKYPGSVLVTEKYWQAVA